MTRLPNRPADPSRRTDAGRPEPVLARFETSAPRRARRGLACALAPAARAQDLPRVDPGRGSVLIHGNFCGPGNRGPGHPPIDALDLACARHDACSPPPLASGRWATCACHDRLHAEADLVARDPRTSPPVRDTARFVSDFALALPCDP